MQSSSQLKQIFHIENKELSETEKIIKRQTRLIDLAGFEVPTTELFSFQFDPEVIGKRNCENLIGSVEIPVGMVGPVKAYPDSSNAEYEIYIPLATTEGALVASTARGCKAITQSGGAHLVIQNNGMTRAPVFVCKTGSQAQQFANWLGQSNQIHKIKQLTEQTSNHLTYISHKSFIRGRHVYTRFNFDTDQAMGMNMVTIALQAALSKIIKKSPVPVTLLSISGNLCTDKKDSTINTLLGRGWWVQAEVMLPYSVLLQVLKVGKVAVPKLIATHVAKNLVGSNLAGSHSQSMQAANIIAAFFAATGQDIAHVGEASQAFTSFEQEQDGIYASVTLPDLPLGTVGGGTGLPAQAQARSLITPHQAVTPRTLAAAVAVAVLAAEISGMAALFTQTLAQAHQKLGRSAKAK